MKSRNIKIQCENGLHLRVAAEVVRRVQNHKSTVKFSCRNCPMINACSILELMMLAASKGENVYVLAEGEDADKVLDSLEELFSDGSGI